MIYLPPPSSVNTTARSAIEMARHDKQEIESLDAAALEMTKLEETENNQAVKNKAVLATVNIGTTFVQAGMIAKGQVEGYKQAARSHAAKQQVAQNINQARATQQPAKNLKDVQLTEHTKLGDRFNDAQQKLLTDGKHFDEKALKSAGFNDKETEELMQLQKKNGGNGVSADQAADFVVKHQDMPVDTQDKQAKALQGEMIKNLLATPERVLAGSGKISQQNAKRTGEIKGQAVGLRDQMYSSAGESRDHARTVANVVSNGRR